MVKEKDLEKYVITIRSRSTPIPYEISCSLDDFKPKTMVAILKGVEETIKAIMEKLKEERVAL